ncbi:unnamed protein product [Rotaria sp. Silwood1]|nr:unnamed protein product [Rotaria sp. Silwood1]CAF1493427.1 unnamed protein product [Rotaria sp. Silwood1]CAF1498146.1 unnamed protein product [Rotaria sp. Silwood1]CAF3769048.1 unnamed protein product [Rotaria sp. Silwood1]CAF4672839.1 unnamed protein product [Rotaria sp. Silwood1]
MIVSGIIGEQVVPIIEDLPYLDSIYVFCCNKSKHKLWVSKHRKIKDIVTEIEPLCEFDCPTRDLNALYPSFMYSKLLKEIFVQIEDDNQAKTELVEFCCNQCEDNQHELIIIDEFKNTYSPSLALW